MPAFDPTAYGPVLGELLRAPRLQPLGAGQPKESARPLLDKLTVASAFAHGQVVAADLAACCLAGVWLLHDFLDESHRISQDIGTATGSWWHGIMHRREGDFWNAGYWFRRVGSHPVYPALRERAASLVAASADPAAAFLTRQTAWEPFAFNDLCQAAVQGKSAVEPLCRQVQQAEWELLFAWCYRNAVQVGGAT